MDFSSLKDKVVIVTGAGRERGQGAAAARALARHGAQVILGDVDRALGAKVAAGIGGGAHYLDLDVTREADWEVAVEAARRLGGLHGLVNNAGIIDPNRLADTSAASFSAHVGVNQLGTFLGMRIASPLMAECGGGSIVNVSSSSGLRASVRAFAYCATKWAVRGMTKAAAVDLARHRIRVNSIHPGPISTDMTGNYTEEERRQRMGMVPLARFGEPAEVADLVCFLLSDLSGYITGAEISIDGGVTL